MKPQTRQTALGVAGLTIVFTVALTEGFNGRVATAYAMAVVGLIAPETLEGLQIWSRP